MPAKASARRLFFVSFGILLACFFMPGFIGSVHAQSEDNHTIYLPVIDNNNDPRWQWSTAITVELTPAPQNTPRLTLDRSGQLHIFWDTGQTPRFIYHTYLSEHGWTTPAAVAQTLGTSNIASTPSVGQNGDIHLVWQNDLGRGVENRYRLMYARFDAATWTAEEALFHNPNGPVQGLPYTDAQGILHVVVKSNNIVTSKYHQLTQTEGVWTSTEIIDPPKGNALTIAVWSPSPLGGIHFFADGLSDKLFYSYWQDGQFPIQAKEFTGKLWGRPLQADGDGNLHPFWTGQVPVPGGQTYGLYKQCLTSNLVWSQPLVLSKQHRISGAIATATDALTQVAFAWTEDNQHVRLALWNGCTQTDDKEIPFVDVPTLNLNTIVISQEPYKLCALARQSSTDQYMSLCADITR
jgi:hypothetical protein